MAKTDNNSRIVFRAIGIVLIVFLGFLIFRAFKVWKAGGEISNLSMPSAAPDNVAGAVCPERPSLPKGYSYQEPQNSFFGITFKDGEGKVCDVILGPTYSAEYEGFVGEQIQINSYSSAVVTADKLMTEDRGMEVSRLNGRLRYSRSGYGGEDQVLAFQTKDILIQLIWRETGMKNQLDEVVSNLAKQLE